MGTETLIGTAALGLSFTLTKPQVFGGSTSYPFSEPDLIGTSYGSGTGADNVNQFYNVQMTLGAGQTKLFNLYNGAQDGLAAPADAAGNVLTMATIKELVAVIMGNLGCSFLASAAVSSGGAGSGYTQQNTLLTATIVNGTGSGNYVLNDVLTIDATGGTVTTAATLKVTSVAGGIITSVSILNVGLYTVNPTNVLPSFPTNTPGAGSLSGVSGATFGLTMAPGTQTLTLVGGNYLGSAVIHSGAGGTSYAIGDVLTVAGGTGTAATLKVLTLGGSNAVATVAVLTIGSYTSNPTTSNNSVTGGSGSGCGLDLTMIAAIPAQINATISFGGAVAGVASVAVPGSYLALPPVSACTVTGGGGTGATFDLTLGIRTQPVSGSPAATDAVYVESDILTLGAASTNPWTGILTSTGTYKLYSGTRNSPGRWYAGEGGSTGYVVGPSSNNILKIVNGGSNPVTLWLILAGATA